MGLPLWMILTFLGGRIGYEKIKQKRGESGARKIIETHPKKDYSHWEKDNYCESWIKMHGSSPSLIEKRKDGHWYSIKDNSH